MGLPQSDDFAASPFCVFAFGAFGYPLGFPPVGVGMPVMVQIPLT